MPDKHEGARVAVESGGGLVVALNTDSRIANEVKAQIGRDGGMRL